MMPGARVWTILAAVLAISWATAAAPDLPDSGRVTLIADDLTIVGVGELAEGTLELHLLGDFAGVGTLVVQPRDPNESTVELRVAVADGAVFVQDAREGTSTELAEVLAGAGVARLILERDGPENRRADRDDDGRPADAGPPAAADAPADTGRPDDPAPDDPAPDDPAPSDPAPSDPAPSDPGPSDPGPPVDAGPPAAAGPPADADETGDPSDRGGDESASPPDVPEPRGPDVTLEPEPDAPEPDAPEPDPAEPDQTGADQAGADGGDGGPPDDWDAGDRPPADDDRDGPPEGTPPAQRR